MAAARKTSPGTAMAVGLLGFCLACLLAYLWLTQPQPRYFVALDFNSPQRAITPLEITRYALLG
jgi:hypothetical protein